MVTMTCTRLMRLKGRSPVSMLHSSTPAAAAPSVQACILTCWLQQRAWTTLLYSQTTAEQVSVQSWERLSPRRDARLTACMLMHALPETTHSWGTRL